MASGQKRRVVVLHVDMLKLEVHVSLRQDLVHRKARKVSSLAVAIFAALYLTSTLHSQLRDPVVTVAVCLVLSRTFSIFTSWCS